MATSAGSAIIQKVAEKARALSGSPMSQSQIVQASDLLNKKNGKNGQKSDCLRVLIFPTKNFDKAKKIW